MRYNHQTDYYISREIAETWWKSMPAETYSVIDAYAAGDSGKRSEPSNGVWVVVNARETLLAGVVTQFLKDDSGRWGLSVLWYDRERSSGFSKFFNGSTLTQSKEAADCIGVIVRQQGGTAVEGSK
jgi:hypothetical protein